MFGLGPNYVSGLLPVGARMNKTYYVLLVLALLHGQLSARVSKVPCHELY